LAIDVVGWLAVGLQVGWMATFFYLSSPPKAFVAGVDLDDL